MTKKTLIISIVIVVLVVVATIVFVLPEKTAAPTTPSQPNAPTAIDPLNATYIVDGQPVTLVNGSSGTTTKVFGQPVLGDLNGDGKTDVAVFLVENPGGSGTFYFAAAALATATGTQGTNAVLLGDRIAPQTLEIQNGQIVANYADRGPDEPMSAQPSIGVTKYFVVSGTSLVAAVPVVGAGEHCGGNIMNAPTCASGYHCASAPGSHLPFGDVGGICIAN